MKKSRREFLKKSMLTSAGVSLLLAEANAAPRPIDRPGKRSVNIFSKNLHWLNYNDMAAFAAELGFDGIDLTVRPEGHVEPARVTEDLPKALDAAKKHGVKIHSIVTAITSASDPNTESILKTASSLGIAYYRMGWMNYRNDQSIEENMSRFRSDMKALDAINRQFKIRGDYQNHAGLSFGSPVWDLWTVLKELSSEWTGSQFDVMHAQTEGGHTWELSLKLLKDFVHTIDIKDFVWVKKEQGWRPEPVPIGQGMVDYKKYVQLLKAYNLEGPYSMHFEYALGGIENGAKAITISRAEATAAMKRDLNLFRAMLKDAGLN